MNLNNSLISYNNKNNTELEQENFNSSSDVSSDYNNL